MTHKSLPLILAREFAANIATPVSVWDERGRLVYFNEPAERIVGRSHADVGELEPAEWTKLFAVERIDGTPVLLEEMRGHDLVSVEAYPHDRDLRRTVRVDSDQMGEPVGLENRACALREDAHGTAYSRGAWPTR